MHGHSMHGDMLVSLNTYLWVDHNCVNPHLRKLTSQNVYTRLQTLLVTAFDPFAAHDDLSYMRDANDPDIWEELAHLRCSCGGQRHHGDQRESRAEGTQSPVAGAGGVPPCIQGYLKPNQSPPCFANHNRSAAVCQLTCCIPHFQVRDGSTLVQSCCLGCSRLLAHI